MTHYPLCYGFNEGTWLVYDHDLRNNRVDAAWAGTTAEFKSFLGRERLHAFVRSQPVLKTDLAFCDSQEIEANGIRLIADIFRAPATPAAVRVLLAEEQGRWKVERLPGGTWMIGGGLPVAELARRLETALSGQQGTVSAWLPGHLGRPPKVGDEYQEAGLKFVVRGCAAERRSRWSPAACQRRARELPRRGCRSDSGRGSPRTDACPRGKPGRWARKTFRSNRDTAGNPGPGLRH